MSKGMILAAGMGNRLRPLTEWLPKPLLCVANTPVMLQGIFRLREAGISGIGANVSYMGKEIQKALGDGSTHGVNLTWSEETELLGTAGGMKRLEPFLRDDLIVLIAGDAMLDIDLNPIIRFHREKGAVATIGTLHVDDCSQYGVVATREDGRIIKFQEKPAPGTEISNYANTGIYVFGPQVFDMIPAETFFDFAHDVFPIILTENLPFYAYPVNGYWTDIGSPKAYLQANMDYLAGFVRTAGLGERINGNLIGAGAKTDGANLVNCVIGQNAIIPSGSSLTNCVVWPDTVLSKPKTICGAVLTPYGEHVIDDRLAVVS